MAEQEVIVAKAKDFWTRNSLVILGVGTVLLLAVGGFFVYKKFFKEPKEEKALNELYKAEEYYRSDSTRLALNGDGQYPGLLRIIDRYSGTAAANVAHYMAGVCYIKLNDNANAITHLKKFSGRGADQIQQRAYKLLGDAYADQGNFKEAVDYYKKAAHEFEDDMINAAEALDLAAYAAYKGLNDTKQAIELYKEIKQKYSQSPQAQVADKRLAQLGEYNVD